MTKQEKLIKAYLKRCAKLFDKGKLQECLEMLIKTTDEVNDYADIKCHKKSIYINKNY